MLICLFGGGQFIAQRLSRAQSDSVQGLSCSHHLRDLFLSPLLFEGETLYGVVRATERDRQTDRSQDPFCWPQPLCHGWPHPPKMARLRHRADPRTPPTPAAIAACFTDPVQTRRIALHEPPRTAIVPPSTGLLLEEVHDRVIEAPQQATVRGGYASLLLSYSLLSHCCGSSYCCCRCCCCCGCRLCGCLLFPSSIEYILC